MRTIIWFIYFGLYLLGVLPKTLWVKAMLRRGETERAKPIIENTVKTWAQRLMNLAGVSAAVTGKENIPEEAALFVANHQGNFDIPLMLCELGPLKSMVAKIEMYRIPVLRTWMEYFHCIFMDRDDPRQSLQCLNQAQKQLEGGQSVMIFPEGTRGKGGPMGEFKAGAFRCALKSGAPIVPVIIDGSFRAMESQGIWIRPTQVKITILPAIATRDMEKERTKYISEEVRQLISDGLEKDKLPGNQSDADAAATTAVAENVK